MNASHHHPSASATNQHPPQILAVIPARLQSKRLPRKLLLPVHHQKPLIAYSYENAKQMLDLGLFNRLILATDSEEILTTLKTLGGEAMLTSPTCANGSERSAEVLKTLEAQGSSFDFVLNLQGDEPSIPHTAVHTLTKACKELYTNTTAGNTPTPNVITLMKTISPQRATHPNSVKVVTTLDGYALYFSRSPIPFTPPATSPTTTKTTPPPYKQHIGLYAYTSDFLKLYPTLPPTPLELSEKLEQLRILEHGYNILVHDLAQAHEVFMDINNLEDFRRFQEHIKSTQP